MSDSGDVLQSSSPTNKEKAHSRVLVTDQEMGVLTSQEWQNRWRQQESYVIFLESKTAQQEGELSELRQAAEKARTQLFELQQREKVIVRRLTAKEQETQDYVVSSLPPIGSSNVLNFVKRVKWKLGKSGLGFTDKAYN